MGALRVTLALGAFALALAASGASSRAFAQGTVNDMLASKASQNSGTARLLVEGREIVYDKDKNTVSAVGDVELNYNGRTLQADRVTYDRGTGRVRANGNVRLIEQNGAVTTGDRFELTDDFKTGFIDSLRAQQTAKDRTGPYTTRFSAPRGERVDGETTVFSSGTYTTCEACREHPERPPLWQVKAARIIQNNEEHRIYYEDAAIEFAGVPVAYIPYFWSPDPSVRRETGFLAPHLITSSALGYGAAIPYFIVISPDKDLTLTPTFYTRQGFLAEAEYRQRFLTGAFNIRAAGIFQQDKSAFLDPPYGAGNRNGRGSIETTGRFNINDRWQYGWDVALVSDKWFLQNYKIRSESIGANYMLAESTSQLWLRGMGDRSFFDLRGYYFQGLSYADWQKQLPVAAPVIDYDKRINGPDPIGGELRFQFNFTNVSRTTAQFQPTTAANQTFPYIGNTTYYTGTSSQSAAYESCAIFQRSSCVVRGLSGDYARASTEVSWRRTFIDDAGQVWIPFTYVKADGFFNNPNTNNYQNAEITNYVSGKQQVLGQVTPAVGLEYRYPFVADGGAFGTHTLTPIAQIVARPNESRIGRLPNEDAHSLVFDDTTLFEWNKFSGNDRNEGGVRANVGMQYNVITPAGWTGSALVGQSYQLAGANSYATSDITGIGPDSGLGTRVSDVVARAQVNPNENFSLIARTRMDKDTFNLNSLEVQAIANFKPYIPVSTTLTYARYAAQPSLGYTHRREGLQPGAAWQITPNWSVSGSVLYDLDHYLDLREDYVNLYNTYTALYGTDVANASVTYKHKSPWTVSSTNLQLGYRDECTTLTLNYVQTPRTGSSGERDTDRTFLVRLELRSIGQTGFSQTLTTVSSADGVSSH